MQIQARVKEVNYLLGIKVYVCCVTSSFLAQVTKLYSDLSLEFFCPLLGERMN